MFSRKYNQRTKQWDIKIIKADKGYEYIPLLIAKMLHARLNYVDIVTRNISLNASDPRLLPQPLQPSHHLPLQNCVSGGVDLVYLHHHKPVNQKTVIFRKIQYPWKTELSESKQSVARLRCITFFNFYAFALT